MKRLLNVVLAWSAVAAAPLLSTTAHAALGVCDALPADNVEVEATAGTPGPTSYNTLKLAFDAINAGTHQGSINIEVCGNTTEAASAVLNASGSGAALYTDIAIKPVGGAARTLAGTLAGAPLIDLNGADAVTIDGLNAGGNSLTLQNASTAATAGTSTVRFIGGASGNTITRTAVQGSSLVPLATAGGTITFSTDTVALTGNDNNTISFCDIGPVGAALPIKAVFGLGTTTTLANYNSGVVIDHNNIFDFFGTGAASVSGIHVLGGNDAWTISNNKLYQTAPRTFTATARYAGITLSGTTTGGAFTVTGNTIGFGASNGTGTTTISGGANEFRGIDAVTTNITTPTVYQNNIVSGINQSTSDSGTTTSASFIGITLGTSDGRYNAIGNQVGSLDGSSTIVLNNSTTTSTLVYGIFDFSFQSNTIANNSIGSITIQGTGTATGFRGILWNTGAALTETVTNNTVGSATGPIVDLQVGNNSVYGFNGVSAAANLSGNTASYLSANSISAATPIVTVAGYIIGSTSTTVPSTIARNSAHHLSNNAGVSANGGSVYGISASLPTTLANVVERNLLHTFDATATNTAYQLAGIVASAGTTTYRNNIVSLGFNAAGNPITAGYVILGLFDPVTGTATTSQFYYNSVFIGGSGVTAPGSNSYALYSNVVTNPRNFQNNILWNTRGNAVAGGSAHLAIRIGATTAGLTSNYNDLLADGTDGAVGVFNATIYPTLANWQTATTQDPLSLSVNPMFVALTNLHLQPGSPAIAMGTSIAGITDDFDGDLRPAVNPSIGADEFVPGHITIAPASFDFGNQTVGVPSAPTSITLSNTGGAPLSVTAITAAASPFSAAGGTCGPTPITIAVGASCTLDYTFTPTAAGPASQPFTVTANVAGDTTFTLSGTGLPVTHTVTSSVGTPSGTITPPSAVVNDGATTAFTVTANPGFHFDTIGGTCPAGSMAGNTYTTGAITADCTVVANFAADIVTHTVTSSVGTPSGTITPPSVVVNDGATAAFTVTANPGFHFDTIGGTCPAGSMAGSTYTTGAITADCTVVANFAADGGGSDTFSNNNPVNIPDDAYNGTQASMACSAIDASSLPAGDTVTSVTITTGLTHTWAGDLVAKLFSPSGSVLAVFSRPGFAEPADDGTGGFGDSSNLLATSPLMFNDAAAADAETMGGTLASSGVICQDDSVCSYHANHGAAAGLTSFAGFNGGAASGTWTLCVGDAGGGDTGSIQNWSITIGHAGAVTHTVTSSVGTPSGTITPPSVVVNDGATAAFTVTANAGFHFDTIGGTCPAGSMAGNTYTTGAIIADCTVVANFAPDVVTHTVTSSVGTPSGTITPPSVVVNDGATAAFTVTANAGFHFDTIGGTCPAGSMAGNTYTTGAITADCTVVANFAADPVPPSATVTPATLSFTVQQDQTGTQTLNIANAAGSDPLTFSITGQASRARLIPYATTRSARDLAGGDLLRRTGTRTLHAGTAGHTPVSPWSPVDVDGGAVTFQADDGSIENGIAWTDGAATPTQNTALWLNRYTATGALTINTVSIAWPNTTAAAGDVTGKTVNLVAYFDANADGDPTDAVRLGSNTPVTINGPTVFENYPANFVVPAAGDVYLGFVDSFATGGTQPPLYSAGLDTNGNAAVGWVAAKSVGDADVDVIGNNDNIGTLSGLSGGTLAGVWMVRGTGTSGPTACAGAPVNWLSASPASGSVNGGANTNVTVTADPAADNLAPGSYTGMLCITTNDPTQTLIAVPVSLTVTAAPFVPCSGGADEIFCDGFDPIAAGPGMYTDRTTFLTHVATGFYENPFADAVPGPIASLSYTNGSWAYTVSASTGTLYNDTGLVSTDAAAASIVVTFTGAPVTAVGGNFWATDISVAPTGTDVTILLSDGTTETFTSTGPTDFRGFTTAAPITSISIDAPDAPVTAWGTMDNLIIGTGN